MNSESFRSSGVSLSGTPPSFSRSSTSSSSGAKATFVKTRHNISTPIAEPSIYLHTISLGATHCGEDGYYLLLIRAFLTRTLCIDAAPPSRCIRARTVKGTRFNLKRLDAARNALNIWTIRGPFGGKQALWGVFQTSC